MFDTQALSRRTDQYGSGNPRRIFLAGLMKSRSHASNVRGALDHFAPMADCRALRMCITKIARCF